MSKTWLFILVVALILIVWAQTSPENCVNCPTVELDRDGKPIIAIKTSPDNVSDIFIIEYLDVQTGILEQVNLKAHFVRVAGITLWFDERTRMNTDLTTGSTVWAVYNPDLTDNSGNGYLLELLPYSEKKPIHKALHRFIIHDPEPYRTLVRFGEEARAYGHLAQVERVKGLREIVALGDGSVAYLEAADRFEVKLVPRKDAVEVVQGKSHAWGRKLDYDNGTGLASVLGPIRLERAGDEPLEGSSDLLIYDVDSETLTLKGKVVLKQSGRTTNAETAHVSESEGYAYLYGNPVISKGADGEVRGKVVRYNLDNGELLVMEGIEAIFEDVR